MKSLFPLLLSMVAISVSAAADEKERPSGSLWTGDSFTLFADNRALKAGDIVTILVQESASASSSAATKSSRDESAGFDGVTGSRSGVLSPVAIANHLLGPFQTGSKSSLDGKGQTNRSGTLSTRLTAVVKEVKPNGNLVIEGSRLITVNAEKQKVTLTGEIRPKDIGPNNTVSSVAIANASIQFDGKGPVGEKQRKGILSTIFGWLF